MLQNTDTWALITVQIQCAKLVLLHFLFPQADQADTASPNPRLVHRDPFNETLLSPRGEGER